MTSNLVCIIEEPSATRLGQIIFSGDPEVFAVDLKLLSGASTLKNA